MRSTILPQTPGGTLLRSLLRSGAHFHAEANEYLPLAHFLQITYICVTLPAHASYRIPHTAYRTEAGWLAGKEEEIMALTEPTVTVLGPDPSSRAYIINGNAFQQDAITSFGGWQYAVFYSSPLANTTPVTSLYVHLARRELPHGTWQVLVFDDYEQTADDGHNTVQMGICPGDGTIHLSYDHHCDT